MVAVELQCAALDAACRIGRSVATAARVRWSRRGCATSRSSRIWPADGKFTGIYRERQVDAAQKLYGAMGLRGAT